MMNALEKLGWKWYKNEYGWISFFDKQRRMSIHIPSKKVRIECEPTFDEILALAEVIKEMENPK